VAENQPGKNQNRMSAQFFEFTARLREFIRVNSTLVGGHCSVSAPTSSTDRAKDQGSDGALPSIFDSLALQLFALQFAHNAPYRRFSEARGATPRSVMRWADIPALPTSAFKELELSCLPFSERTRVFHSSGTTEERVSRHFHNAESLAIYEASLWPWFAAHLLPDFNGAAHGGSDFKFQISNFKLAVLTPPQTLAPRSSLVHMFDTVRRELGASESVFVGRLRERGAWTLNFDSAVRTLRSAVESQTPLLLLGTAFSFVHLLDFLSEKNLRFELPAGSRVLETGGYKGRSRALPKTELHGFMTRRLGIPRSHIICEYGMSELSSQAYDAAIQPIRPVPPHPGPLPKERENPVPLVDESIPSRHSSLVPRHFHFPPWARAQIISPETGREVAEGETGLIRVFDLANVFSVVALQIEDLAVRRADSFELIGRAALAEPRGCSLMTA
jgi:hypothetical protein